ncbi:MAG: M48 family metallopeptidase [Patescibacteria group bacterium]
MATLYTQQSKNISKTWLLMGVFLAFIVAIGYFASDYYGNPAIVYFAIIFSIVMNISGYWFSDKVALAVSGAKPIQREENRELYRIVENLSITAGIPMPALFLINDPSPNAFATGRDKNHASIAVTSGLLGMMDKTELEGVLAHEMSHIGNRDILLQSVIVVLVGIIAMMSNIMMRSNFRGGNRDREGGNAIIMIIGIVLVILSPIVATIIQLAISRKREFLADATGALITRYPEGLASALQKISDYPRGLAKASNATAHMFIANPFGGDSDSDGALDKNEKISWLAKMFMTHPPVEERIKALLGK